MSCLLCVVCSLVPPTGEAVGCQAGSKCTDFNVKFEIFLKCPQTYILLGIQCPTPTPLRNFGFASDANVCAVQWLGSRHVGLVV